LLARQPAQDVVQVAKDIYELCGKELPRILLRSGLVAAFHKKVVLLPSVQRFQLCESHNEDYRTKLLREMELAAVKELLAKTSRALHDKRGNKGRRKTQRVSHR